VDVNRLFVKIVPVDIVLANKDCVLNCLKETPSASTVDRDEIPVAKIEYRVEFVDPIDVLKVKNK
jgi:hypothetical protein